MKSSSPKSLFSGKTVTSFNPATGEALGKVKVTGQKQIAAACVKARLAQAHWQELSFTARAAYIYRMRDYLLAHTDRIAEIISNENGKTRMDALVTEIMPMAGAMTWYADNAGKELRPHRLKTASLLFFNKRNMIQKVPMGVIGIISPWNYPFAIPFHETVMALMAGNAVMLKVSEYTLLAGELIVEIVRASGLPDGLFSHSVNEGQLVLDTWLENGVAKLFFTGSAATGRKVMTRAAEALVPVSLELGGKDAMIVLEDADLERAVNGAMWAGFQNAGQSCAAVERVYVAEPVYDRFVERLAAETKKLRHGRDTGFNVDIGAVTMQKQYDTINDHVNDALGKGAKIAARSLRVGSDQGLFYPATVLTNVKQSMKVMQEETFGPVLPVVKFSTIDEAVALANDSKFGLTASVWTRNKKLGRKIASRLEAGVVNINDHLYTHGGHPEAPWGGFKWSGIGRTHGGEGLLEMTRTRVVNEDLFPLHKNLWWFPASKKSYLLISRLLGVVYKRSGKDFLQLVSLLLFGSRKR